MPDCLDRAGLIALLGKTAVARVELSEGAAVYVRQLSVGQRSQWERTVGKMDDVRAAFLVRVLCDADGRLLFEETETAAVQALFGPALDRVWWAAMRFNKLTGEDLEELKKNCPTPSNA